MSSIAGATVGVLMIAALAACSADADGTGGAGGSVLSPTAGTEAGASSGVGGAAAIGGSAGVGGSAGSGGGGGSGGGSGGGAGGSGGMQEAGSDAGGEDAAMLDATLRLYNVYNDEPDPRFDTLPAGLSSVELLPQTTVQAVAPGEAHSVRFQAGALSYLDVSAPFRLSEDESGAAIAWQLTTGSHDISATFYASADGSGTPLGELHASLELTSAGTDTTPEAGAHSQHKLWIKAGAYDAASGDFAFMVLLPEGYDPSVHYPLVVLLHHGDPAYRGTDNNGLPLTTDPLFTGTHAIHSSSTRIDYPAVVLIPQLIAQETIDSVTHEWAAFRSLSNDTGDYVPGDEPSRSANFVLRVIDDMIESRLMVDGQAVSVDGGRIYVTGHSMGGFGTWDFLIRRPTFFAAGVPMAGYQDHESAALLVDMPIWAFHHQIDSYNAFHSDTMQSLIQAAGGTKMKLTKLTFDTGGQGDQAHFRTPAAAWNDEPGLFDWIFSQARARP